MIQRILAAALLFGALLVQPSNAAVWIRDDMGGSLGDYILKFSNIRKSGQLVIIDGDCYSACTLVTGAIPRKNICVTRRAAFGFHAALVPGLFGSLVVNDAATHAMFNLYPTNIKLWVNRHGGLGAQPIVLDGRELASMYPACPQSVDSRF
jgi:hypothetical protein